MARKYRVETVRDHNPHVITEHDIQEALDSCGPDERLHTILSRNDGGGYTGAFFLIFERTRTSHD